MGRLFVVQGREETKLGRERPGTKDIDGPGPVAIGDGVGREGAGEGTPPLPHVLPEKDVRGDVDDAATPRVTCASGFSLAECVTSGTAESDLPWITSGDLVGKESAMSSSI
jgi:hypothetical protein